MEYPNCIHCGGRSTDVISIIPLIFACEDHVCFERCNNALQRWTKEERREQIQYTLDWLATKEFKNKDKHLRCLNEVDVKILDIYPPDQNLLCLEHILQLFVNIILVSTSPERIEQFIEDIPSFGNDTRIRSNFILAAVTLGEHELADKAIIREDSYGLLRIFEFSLKRSLITTKFMVKKYPYMIDHFKKLETRRSALPINWDYVNEIAAIFGDAAAIKSHNLSEDEFYNNNQPLIKSASKIC